MFFVFLQYFLIGYGTILCQQLVATQTRTLPSFGTEDEDRRIHTKGVSGVGWTDRLSGWVFPAWHRVSVGCPKGAVLVDQMT